MTHWNLEGQWVILRIDGNVPLAADGKIIDDYRLARVKPTIDYILKQGGRIILITHIGEPTKRTTPLSTRHLLPWFSSYYPTVFAPTLSSLKPLKKTNADVLILENIRFFKGETTHNLRFAQTLAQYASYYVNDAFGTMHRTDSSLVLLAEQFNAKHRSYGFLVAQELTALAPLLKPHKNALIMIGGAKLSTKIPLVTHLLSQGYAVAVLPALSFTFNRAQGIEVGKSLVEKDLISPCKALLKHKGTDSGVLILPLDYQVAQGSITGPLAYTNGTTIARADVGIAVGPQTIALLEKMIMKASVIFFNGLMGFTERKETLKGSKAILTAMNKAEGTTIIAGGDTIAYAHQENLADAMDYVSTGGGATLAYLSGQPLPALALLLEKRTKA
jgi:phosphoglycerate kinase